MSFNHLTGQKNIKMRLASESKGDRSGTFMITGFAGMGRKSFAEEFAKALMCENPGDDGACDKCPCCKYFEAGTTPDIVRVYQPSDTKNVKVAYIKESVVAEAVLKPQFSRKKVFIIDMDYLGPESQNALLKSLEEPPAHVVFILLTSSRDRVLDTVVSRATEIKLEPYTQDEIAAIVKANVESCPDAVVAAAAANCGGVPGKAISLASQGDDLDLRDKIADMIIGLPQRTYCQILNDDDAFITEHKDDAILIAADILYLLEDILKVVSLPECEELMFKERKNDIKKMIASCKGLDSVRIGKCSAAVSDFLKALSVNSNFDAATCSMLLKIHEEFTR